MVRRESIKSAADIELLRANNVLVSKTLAALAPRVKPGVKTIELDAFAESFIRDHGAEPGFLGYSGFPYTLCISVNDAVVHGFPGDYELQDGDIVSIDCGTKIGGFYGDSAFTFGVGEISDTDRQLLDVTRRSLELGIAQARAGNRTGDIGNAVQDYAESFGYGVVREMVGHGLGRSLHERPEVPNYGRRGRGALLRPGLCICIEPMITQGDRAIYQARDGWTIRTMDKSKAAHFEKAVVITAQGGPDVLTDFSLIDASLSSLT